MRCFFEKWKDSQLRSHKRGTYTHTIRQTTNRIFVCNCNLLLWRLVFKIIPQTSRWFARKAVEFFLRQQPFRRIFVVVYFMDFTLICQTVSQQRMNCICEAVEAHAQCTYSLLMMCRFFESKDGGELVCIDGLHHQFHGISLALFSLSVWRLNGGNFAKKDTRIYWKRIN